MLEFGATAARGDTSAFLLGAVLTPVRRGPLRLAFTWDYVSVRTAVGRVFGFGDPKAFARLRLAGPPGSRASLFIEGMARIPTADPGLFPYAVGGQEIELDGTLCLGREQQVLLGGGYIWSEPPAGGRLTAAALPHATHAVVAFAPRVGRWSLRARADHLWMGRGRRRTQLEGSVSRPTSPGLRPTLAVACEIGPRADRVLDASVALRFAMPLR